MSAQLLIRYQFNFINKLTNQYFDLTQIIGHFVSETANEKNKLLQLDVWLKIISKSFSMQSLFST